ncbi:hypothetical protein A6R73_01565 [Xanthomonas translucens pv. poae]|uniref:Uncharacterized protein n=1 Tax=Xanthomonas graminis pv. poae TaxID=227946 RepID=A0A199P6U1_9XANT|nr:hypothetical protein A6R73_01565 [Xanthomonas translucens pv. poae]
MVAMTESPDDSIAQDWGGGELAHRIHDKVVKWHDLIAIHVVSHLPTDASARFHHPQYFRENLIVSEDEVINGVPRLILFPHAIWGRSSHQRDGFVGQGSEQVDAIAIQ